MSYVFVIIGIYLLFTVYPTEPTDSLNSLIPIIGIIVTTRKFGVAILIPTTGHWDKGTTPLSYAKNRKWN
jgi:hypothetical protein